MKIDSRTTVGLATSTHVVNGFKKFGSKSKRQVEQVARQEGIQTDQDTSKVMMATSYAATPAIKSLAAQLVIVPAYEAAQKSLNEMMSSNGVIEKKIGSKTISTVDGFQKQRQNILNAASNEQIILNDDRFKDHRVASVNGGVGGTNVSINLSNPVSLTQHNFEKYTKGETPLLNDRNSADFYLGNASYQKAFGEELKHMDGASFRGGTLNFRASGETLNIEHGFSAGATDIRESMELLLSRYEKQECGGFFRSHTNESGHLSRAAGLSRGFAPDVSAQEIDACRKTIVETLKRAKRTENLGKLYLGFSNPKNLLRSGFYLSSMTFNQSETAQGAKFIRPIAQGIRLPGKMLNAGINLSAAVTRNLLIKPKALKNAIRLSPKDAGVRAILRNYRTQKDLITLNANAFMKGNVKFTKYLQMRAKENFRKAFLQHLKNKGKLSARGIGALDAYFTTKDRGLVAGFKGRGKSKEAKTIDKQAKKALKKVLRNENLLYGKVYRKISNTKIGKATEVIFNKISSAAERLRKLSFKNFLRERFLKTRFGQGVGRATVAFMGAVKHLLLWGLLLLLVCILVLTLLCIAADLESYSLGRDRQYTTAYQQEKTTKRGKKIMKYLKENHDNAIRNLEAEQAMGDVSDTNFPNGTKENYKEIYTMLQVVCAYDMETVFDGTSNKDLKNLISMIYDNTHKLTSANYTYSDATGTHTARHINYTVFRDDMGCYEALSEYTGVVASGGDAPVAVPDISGECLSADWSTVYTTVKTLIAQSGATYSQTSWQTISVTDANGTESYRLRQDCSGYVFACIRAYQHMMGLPQSAEGYSGTFVTSQSIPGFTKLDFSVNALQPGDIIAKGGEHAEIFAGSSGGVVYAYSNGCTDDMRVAGATKSVNISGYDVIWRCNGAIGNSNAVGGSSSAGTSSGSGNISAEVAKSITQTTGSHLNDISTDPKTVDEFLEYTDNTMYVLGYSNMSDITFNEDTGNEDGYETTLLATINTAKSNGYFTPDRFTNNDTITYEKPDVWSVSTDKKAEYITYTTNKNHIPSESSKINSADYIRYLMAKHGVSFPFYGEYSDMLSVIQNTQGGSSAVEEVYTTKNLKVGDIVWYLPKGEALTSDTVSEGDILEYSTANAMIQAGIELKAVPMMYIGDGKVTAYCKDVLKTDTSEYEASSGEIRTYNLSSLNKKRIVKMYHYIGYTVNPVWGSNDFFAGWTDVNVSSVLEAQNQSVWQVSSDYSYETSQGETISYKSFYNGEDYFVPDVYHTDNHDTEFRREMLQLGLKYYDVYGILPSTLYSHAASASDYRTTEESLKAFNVFEKIDNGENGLEVEKYSYDADGKPTVTRKKYKRYSSIEDAAKDLFVSFVKKADGSAYAKTFSEQLSNYRVASGEIRTKMSSVYNSDSSVLDYADSVAVSKKKYIDVLKKKYDATKNLNMNRECTEAEHNDLQTKHDALKKAVADLDHWFSSDAASVAGDPIFETFSSESVDKLRSDANDKLAAMENALTEQEAYLKEQAQKRAILAKQQKIVTNITNNRLAVNDAKIAAYGYFGYHKNKVSQQAYNDYYAANQWLYLSYCDLKNFVAEHPSYEPSGSNSLASLKAEIAANNKELKQIKKDNKLKAAPGI